MRGTSALNGASAVVGVSAKSKNEKRNVRKGLIPTSKVFCGLFVRHFAAREQSVPCFARYSGKRTLCLRINSDRESALCFFRLRAASNSSLDCRLTVFQHRTQTCTPHNAHINLLQAHQRGPAHHSSTRGQFREQNSQNFNKRLEPRRHALTALVGTPSAGHIISSRDP